MQNITSSIPLLAQLSPQKVVLLGETRLGTFICSTPALRALRAILPTTEIVMITAGELGDLVGRSPYLDRFVPLPPLRPDRHAYDARYLTQFFQEMQAEKFDVGIQFQGYGLQSCPFFVLLGALLNVGFVGPSDMPGMIDAAVAFPQQGHVIDGFLTLSTLLGAPARGRYTEFPLTKEDEEEANTLLESAPRPLIGLHPLARSIRRRWPQERFASLAVQLQQRYGGTMVILGEQKQEVTECLASRARPWSCLNLAGRTSLPVLGAVIQRLSLLITNDTGPAHIGYTFKVPTITLFAESPQSPFWPPEEGPFRPLTGTARCIDSITDTQVFEAAESLME